MPQTFVEQVFDRIEQSVDRERVPNRMQSILGAAYTDAAIRDLVDLSSTLDIEDQRALLTAFYSEVTVLVSVCMLKAQLLAAKEDERQ